MSERSAGVARFSVVDVRLDAHEVVDRIEDMLSWEAISSESSRVTFSWDDFRRADPNVSLGGHATGRLTPSCVLAHDCSEWAQTPQEHRIVANGKESAGYVRLFGENFNKTLGMLGERLSYAWIDEVDGGETVFATVSEGDDVSDMRAGDLGEWREVRYHIHSIHELPRDSAEKLKRVRKLPQVARVFYHEHVLAFRDGRAASGLEAFAHWGGRFWGLDRRPTLCDVHAGNVTVKMDMAAWDIAQAWGCQMDRRDEWTVEVSLAKERTGVGIPTDAEGAREFINMLRAGDSTTRGRKSSLVHWVSAHMRQRGDKQEPHLVREHLRGRQTLSAGRYTVKIWPSRSDIERACNGGRFDLTRRAAS